MNETLSLNTSLSVTEGLQDTPEPLICAFYNPDFIIYSSLGSFYIPCLVMIVLYSRIFKVNKSISFYSLFNKQNNPLQTKQIIPSQVEQKDFLWKKMTETVKR